MFVQFKDGVQNHYPVWENILLIEAPDDDAANELAVVRAKEDEGGSDSGFTWDDRPATWVYAGLRKLIKVAHRSVSEEIGPGDELSYSEFDLPNREALDRLVAGDEVDLRYVE